MYGDSYHGQGTVQYTNGDAYIGGFYVGVYSGWGTYYWVNGDYLYGDWIDDNNTEIEGSVFYDSSSDTYNDYYLLDGVLTSY